MAHVLVVDDDVDSGDGLVRLLRRRGHRAVALPNGREALAVLMGATPDLIVLDLRMPHMDGMMLLDVMRSYLRLQQVPVVLLTAYPESPDVGRARELGVREVFRKGDDFTGVLDAVDRHAQPGYLHAAQDAGGATTAANGGAGAYSQ